MVIPITNEQQWMTHLQELPVWSGPAGATLVVAPHPDDETLGAGGLIASLRERGVAVMVVAVTDGESAYLEFGDDGAALAAVREREQTEALARLGVAEECIYRLRLTDSGVTAQEETLVEFLRPLVRDVDCVVAPWTGDFHPDHEACGRAAARIAGEAGKDLAYYFFWTWHRGTVELLDGLPLVSFPLSAKQVEAKHAALEQHVSQLHHASGEPVLPAYLLEPAGRTFEVFLCG